MNCVFPDKNIEARRGLSHSEGMAELGFKPRLSGSGTELKSPSCALLQKQILSS